MQALTMLKAFLGLALVIAVAGNAEPRKNKKGKGITLILWLQGRKSVLNVFKNEDFSRSISLSLRKGNRPSSEINVYVYIFRELMFYDSMNI